MTIALPEPNFIDRDPAVITAEMVALYEQLTGKPLQPAQVERVLIDVFAYRETLVRIGIQEAAKQNLVRYARYPMLDFLGELKGVTRLDAEFALTTLRFTLVAAQAFDVLVPSGTRVESADGKVIFATSAALTIATGDTTGDVAAVAQTADVVGNGYLAGQVATLIDPIAYVTSVANTSTSSGGAALELDDPYRTRIMLAPESYSTAGPIDAYRYHALRASSTIIDVAVESPVPGTVAVHVLTSAGAPSEELLDQVVDYLSDDKLIPVSDLVLAYAAEAVESVWLGSLTVYTNSVSASVLAEVEAQLAAYATALRTTLGQDIVPERIEAIANSVAGVYRFVLSDVAYQVLTLGQYVDVTSITVNLVGVNDG